MQFETTPLPGVVVVEPQVFNDKRGFFMETYHHSKFATAGIDAQFLQDNHSYSRRGALRGLHYQFDHPQGKLVRAIRGEVFDVAVDLRRNSPSFGEWFGTLLSADNRRQLYIPPGLAHGFCVLSDEAEVVYKATDVYHPGDEHTIRWDDAELNIAWPADNPIVSEKDAAGAPFAKARYYE